MKKKNKLVIGKFYLIYGGSPHPAQIFMIDTKHKTFLSIKFGTTQGKHMVRIHPIQKGRGNEQYAHKRPFEGVRSDYSDKEMLGFAVDDKDYQIIEEIKKRNPMKTSKAKKRYKK